MREKFSCTTEEQLPLQNEVESLTGVKGTDRAYHEIERKHQLVQTTPEEFPPEHGMAEQEMHDEATGKKLVCETGMCTCAALIRLLGNTSPQMKLISLNVSATSSCLHQ